MSSGANGTAGGHLISVIMPTLDAEDYVAEAARSVLEQEGAPVELVVQDGGSTDRTLPILKDMNDPRISVESASDDGLGDALNRAISRAKGDWLVWLNADDRFTPGATAAVAPYLSGDAEVLCGDFEQIDAEGEHRKLYISSPLERRRLFRRGVYVFLGSTLVKKDVFERIGGYADDLHFCADWDFCVRAADQAKSVHVPSCLAGYRYHPGSLGVKSPWSFFPEGSKAVRRNATGPGDMIAGYTCLAKIGAYVATRKIWTSDLWRRVGPSSKRL